MANRGNKKREKEKKKARNASLGFCHGCGKGWTKLTWEHVPPLRVQSLIPSKYLRFNPLDKIVSDEKNRSPKGGLPPCVVAHGGLKVKSFGDCCQQLTQKMYGQAFFNWSRIALAMCDSLDVNEDRIKAVVEIQPLNVIKQIASIALATSILNETNFGVRLRHFIQDPEERGCPAGYDFFAYLNPIRPDYGLPQCRLDRSNGIVMDINTKAQVFLVSEVSVPPLGYVVAFTSDAPLLLPVRALMNINHFATCAFNETKHVALDIPIRTPFGPAPVRYMQDTKFDPPIVGNPPQRWQHRL